MSRIIESEVKNDPNSDWRIMNYEEARVYLDEISKCGSVFGLETMRELLRRLDNPQNDLKFIHISGTNGKGSTLAFLSTILSGAGYRTGRYVSPTLFAYRERIQVDGEMIDKESLAIFATAVAKAAKEMEEEGRGMPTAFEQETALSFLYFKKMACDIIVLETGLGGLMDATNVVETTVMEVIASISIDHIGVLGSTLTEIAQNKAGIIKPDTLVVSAKQEPEAEEVIKAVSKEKNAKLFTVDADAVSDVQYGYDVQKFTYKGWKDVEISLAGSYQIANAALALEAVDALRSLGYQLSDEKVYEGMKRAVWRGRFTPIHKDPVVIIDGAHNPAAAKVLRESLELYFKGKKLHYIFGVFSDKEYEQVIQITAPLAADIITVQTPGNPRALPAEELKAAVEKVNSHVKAAGSVEEAVKESLMAADAEDIIVAFGSLSFLGEVDRVIRNTEEKNG